MKREYHEKLRRINALQTMLNEPRFNYQSALAQTQVDLILGFPYDLLYKDGKWVIDERQNKARD